jgi:glycosyltransferase involved in cell wall biosynthesis
MYNEEGVIEIFFKELDECFHQLSYDYEVICVNDGSCDATMEILKRLSAASEKIKILNLSRNFGKEVALTAGLDHATGDAAIPIDCDLQDPINVVPKLIEKWQEGYDVVLAKRVDRQSDTLMKRTTSGVFYRLINKISDIDIPDNVGDFRLMDQKVVEALNLYRENTRFMKGIFAALGFKQATVEYVRAQRVAGTTKWNYWKLYQLAIEGIVSFTSMPLKVWSYLGATVAIAGFFYGLFLIIKTLIFGADTPGYASIMVVLLFMSGLILLCLGVIGEYLSRIFLETKNRPLYIISEKIGFDT